MNLQIKNCNLFLGDCLEILPTLADDSVDLVLADLPFEKIEQDWDKMVDLTKLWAQLNRVCKKDAPIVMFGSQPFTSVLVSSNLKNFKHGWVWQKDKGANFAQVKRSPMKEHEDIVVFSTGRGPIKYFPIKEERKGAGVKCIGKEYVANATPDKNDINGGRMVPKRGITTELRYPSSIQKFNREVGWFSTQKPVDLLSYLIKTYSEPNAVVLDPTMGSCSTGVACIKTQRQFIGIEKNKDHYDLCIKRISLS